MANYRVKSLIWFAATGGITASILVSIVFGFGISITYVFIGSAIFFSGFWGYVLGNHFCVLAKNKSKYKAMFLGIFITMLVVVTSVIISILALVSMGVPIGEAKNNSDVVLFAGIVLVFAIPITIPVGAILGYVIYTPCNDD